MFLVLHHPALQSHVTLHASLLSIVPRVVVRDDIVWMDARGLPVRDTLVRARSECSDATDAGGDIRCAAAHTAIAAEVAVRHGERVATIVRAGSDRDFLAPFPVRVLGADRALENLLDAVGIERCRDLARLTLEEVELRFGGAGSRLWYLSRADDPRRVFDPRARALPEASLEWTDYAIRRTTKLLFVVNALFGSVCEQLQARGDGAVIVTLRFTLANRAVIEHPMRSGRATASRNAWMRLARLELEKIALPDAVTGITLRVDLTGSTGARQGDMFDRGFGTAVAAEAALGTIMDDEGALVVEPDNSAHPLVSRRTTWTSLSAARVMEGEGRTRPPLTAFNRVREEAKDADATNTGDAVVGHIAGSDPVDDGTALTLQLLAEPRRVSVSTVPRRGEMIPHAYRDNGTSYRLIEAAGPDRVSGGRWDDPYAREYFRCVREDGSLVWLYRDGVEGKWFLEGFWD